MCGVGKTMVTVDCGAVNGPTDAPLTTAAPCEDKWSNCPELAQKSCYKVKKEFYTFSFVVDLKVPEKSQNNSKFNK